MVTFSYISTGPCSALDFRYWLMVSEWEEVSRKAKHGLDEKFVFIEVRRTFLIFSTPREI